MAGSTDEIVRHYGGADLYDRIVAAFAAAGVSEDALTHENLKPVDEFHIGGVAATEALLDPLGIGPATRILDLGSGLGGPARFMVRRYGARVTGIDLTPDFVETARRLCALVGIEADFTAGSALDLPFADASFDLVTLIHVGMNLPDKPRLFSEAARVLAPEGRFAVYDVMRFGAHPEFPLPWATTPGASFLDTPEAYLAAAGAAGLSLVHRADRGAVARAFFAEMQAKMAKDGPPVVGLPLLMGAEAPVKVANMVAAVNAGHIQPVEMVFGKD